jgi:hypothetical protein
VLEHLTLSFGVVFAVGHFCVFFVAGGLVRALALCTAFRGVDCGWLSRGALWRGSGFRGAVATGCLATDDLLQLTYVFRDGSRGWLVRVITGVD